MDKEHRPVSKRVKQAISEITSDEAYMMNRLLSAVYLLHSCANAYLETFTDILLKHGLMLPNIKHESKTIQRHFDIMAIEFNRLFHTKEDRINFHKDLMEFSKEIDKLLCFDEENQEQSQQ